MLKIKDKVINNGLKGQIIGIPGNPKLYLIKYPLFTFKNPFKRKLWTFGFDLELEKVEE